MAGLRNARRNKLVCKLKLVDKSRCDEGYTVLEKEEFNPESGDTYGEEKSPSEQFTKKHDAEIKVKIKTKKNRSEKTNGNDADESFERNCKKRHFENFADNILSGFKALIIIIVIIALAGAGHHIAKWRIAEKNKTVEPYKYVLLKDGTYMIDANDTELRGDIVIPSSYNGASVTAIANRAFAGHKITSVTIPDSVTSIGYFAFEGCPLRSVNLGKGLESIENGVFNKCRGLKAVSIPSNVTSIGDYAFENCTELTSVVIPNSVMSIGIAAFARCTKLASITIPDSVTSIGESAFNGCTSFDGVIIPDNVTNIGRGALYGCTNLSIIKIGSGVKKIDSVFSWGDKLKQVIYNGTKEQWYSIIADEEWEERLGECVIFCTNGPIGNVV